MKYALSGSRIAAVAVILLVGGGPLDRAGAADDTAAAAQPGDGDSAVEMPELQEAVLHFKSGDVEGAMDFWKAAAAKNPDLPPAELMLAQMFAQIGDSKRMVAALQQAALEHPADPEAYVILGDLDLGDQRVVEAKLLYGEAARLLADFDKSAQRKKNIAMRIEGGLASIAEATGRLEEAQKHLEAVLAAAPENAAAMQRLGVILFNQDKTDEALKQFAAAQKAAPDQVITPEAVLARLYHAKGDETAARKWMIDALKAAPKDARTRVVAAQWALETGQVNEALTQAEAALTLDAELPDAQLVRGQVAMFQKDYAAAEKYFKAALDLLPGNFAASNSLALALANQDDDEKQRRAVGYAEVNFRQFPRQPEAAATLGWAYYRAGRLKEAEQALMAAQQAGMTPDAAYYLARLYADTNRQAEAKKLLESLLKLKQPFATRDAARELAATLK